MTGNAKIISRKVEFQGWHRLESITVQPRSLKHEGYAKAISREVFYGGMAAFCLPYLPESDEILLSQQFRLGPYLAGKDDPFLYECCGGVAGKDETPVEAMKREALEETGCIVTDFEFIAKTYATPACSDEVFMIYCGRIAKADAGHGGLDEEGEEIKTHLLPATDVIRMMEEGKIINAPTLIALQWFALNRRRLRKKWGGA